MAGSGEYGAPPGDDRRGARNSNSPGEPGGHSGDRDHLEFFRKPGGGRRVWHAAIRIPFYRRRAALRGVEGPKPRAGSGGEEIEEAMLELVVNDESGV